MNCQQYNEGSGEHFFLWGSPLNVMEIFSIRRILDEWWWRWCELNHLVDFKQTFHRNKDKKKNEWTNEHIFSIHVFRISDFAFVSVSLNRQAIKSLFFFGIYDRFLVCIRSKEWHRYNMKCIGWMCVNKISIDFLFLLVFWNENVFL